MAHYKVLAISGSLRINSSATMVLKQAISLFPSTVAINSYEGLAELPPFNDSQDEPLAVKQFKDLLRAADGVFICTPEYAFGVPGTLKNALDWTVSSGEFVNKPVALITAASVGTNAHASLLLILSALSANVASGATLVIPFIRSKLDESGSIKDNATLQEVKIVVDAFVKILTQENSFEN
ncbi:MAG: NADPH-dependent FMN reductase [Ferruginibacter sp.]